VSYTGDFRHGKKHGSGDLVYENGDVFKGHWSNDRKHGKVCIEMPTNALLNILLLSSSQDRIIVI
jgi:hypothetical protein